MSAEIERFVFVGNGEPLWCPRSETFDWSRVYAEKLGHDGQELPNGIDMQVDGYVQPVTAENSTLYLNHVMPDMHAIRIRDERVELPSQGIEDGCFWWFKGLDIGFNGLARALKPHMTIVINHCPQSGIEQLYLRRLMLRTHIAESLGTDAIGNMVSELDDPEALSKWLSGPDDHSN